MGDQRFEKKLWFPTMDGVAIIDPNNIPINKKAPPIYIEKIFVDDNGFSPPKLKYLNPNNKRIVFDFRALSFVVPEKETITISLTEKINFQIDIHNIGMIPDDIRSRFFDKYITSGKKRGTGLGTYSALVIARSHGGNITFETSKQQGTTLSVTLPKII